jgi:hypothetical protein
MGRPLCLALVICDEVIEDRRSGNKSLIGLFNTLAAPSLPFTKRVYVVVSVSGTDELVPLDLRFVSPTGQLASLRLEPPQDRKTQLHDVHDIVIEMRNLEFAQAGLYAFELWDEQGMMASRHFNVMASEPGLAQPVAKG